MDSNLTTADFLALENRGFGRGYDDYGCRRHGAATTGIGLAAGLGGGALLLALAGLWGVNQASKARQKAAEAAAAGNKSAIDILASQTLVERQSRETWQNNHAPTISQYVDVRAGAGQVPGPMPLRLPRRCRSSPTVDATGRYARSLWHCISRRCRARATRAVIKPRRGGGNRTISASLLFIDF